VVLATCGVALRVGLSGKTQVVVVGEVVAFFDQAVFQVEDVVLYLCLQLVVLFLLAGD
jgi:hypothetical protein